MSRASLAPGYYYERHVYYPSTGTKVGPFPSLVAAQRENAWRNQSVTYYYVNSYGHEEFVTFSY